MAKKEEAHRLAELVVFSLSLTEKLSEISLSANYVACPETGCCLTLFGA